MWWVIVFCLEWRTKQANSNFQLRTHWSLLVLPQLISAYTTSYHTGNRDLLGKICRLEAAICSSFLIWWPLKYFLFSIITFFLLKLLPSLSFYFLWQDLIILLTLALTLQFCASLNLLSADITVMYHCIDNIMHIFLRGKYAAS